MCSFLAKRFGYDVRIPVTRNVTEVVASSRSRCIASMHASAAAGGVRRRLGAIILEIIGATHTHWRAAAVPREWTECPPARNETSCKAGPAYWAAIEVPPLVPKKPPSTAPPCPGLGGTCGPGTARVLTAAVLLTADAERVCLSLWAHRLLNADWLANCGSDPSLPDLPSRAFCVPAQQEIYPACTPFFLPWTPLVIPLREGHGSRTVVTGKEMIQLFFCRQCSTLMA